MHSRSGTLALGDGAAIAYDMFGRDAAGPPILVIRPLGSAGALWRPYLRALAERRRILAFDPRGAGGSTGRPQASTRAMADDARRLLEHLGIGRVDVFGQSLGGMIASCLAANPGPRVKVRRLVLASTAARGRDFAHPSVRGLGFVPCAARPADAIEGCLAERILSEGFRRRHPSEARAIIARARLGRARRATLIAQAVAGARHDARGLLAAISADALVLAGEHDDVLGIGPQRALARALPRARFELVEGAGHDLTLEAPQRIASVVSSFCDDDDEKRSSAYR